MGSDQPAILDECHQLLIKVLNREVDLAAMSALSSALAHVTPADSSGYSSNLTLIAFDTNVFLKLSNHRKSADIVDFLRTSFTGKLLLPGQVIQEFWNNQLAGIETLAASIKKQADNLKKEIEKIDSEYGEFANRFEDLLNDFHSSYGYIYDEGTLRKIKIIVSLLSEKALVPYCRRVDLSAIASVRKRTKTPPGFKDELDGDFFVWADLLLGVALLGKDGYHPATVILVTNDAKPDWSRNGVPHPILCAEVKALCNANFEIWSLDKLANFASA